MNDGIVVYPFNEIFPLRLTFEDTKRLTVEDKLTEFKPFCISSLVPLGKDFGGEAPLSRPTSWGLRGLCPLIASPLANAERLTPVLKRPCKVINKIINKTKQAQKVFVFDFDETLGSFSDLYYLWHSIEKTLSKVNFSKVNQSSQPLDTGAQGSAKPMRSRDSPLALPPLSDTGAQGSASSPACFSASVVIKNELFINLFDLYPEFLRYGILVILEFIYFKKLKRKCDKIFIYTNNQCNIEWVNRIIDFISSKIPIIQKGVPLFDKIVYAFKINNKIIETERTTSKKTYGDLIKCTMLSKKTEICFIDDTHHPKMVHNKIYYIQPFMYCHNLTDHEIFTRLFSSKLIDTDKHDEIANIFYSLNRTKTNQIINVNNVEISQKLMFYIKEFIYNVNHSKTEKKNQRIGKFTRKKK
jgi:hypothetical protein